MYEEHLQVGELLDLHQKLVCHLKMLVDQILVDVVLLLSFDLGIALTLPGMDSKKIHGKGKREKGKEMWRVSARFCQGREIRMSNKKINTKINKKTHLSCFHGCLHHGI